MADHRGRISLHSYKMGECLKRLQGHQHEVSELHIDFANKLFISASWDSTVII